MAAAGRVAILSSSIKKGEKRGGGVQKQFGGARLGRAARHTRGAVVVVGAPLCLFPPCGKSEGLAAAPLARAIAARQKGWEQHNTQHSLSRCVMRAGHRRQAGGRAGRQSGRQAPQELTWLHSKLSHEKRTHCCRLASGSRVPPMLLPL